MYKRNTFQIAALVLGGALALPPALIAAEKDIMKDDNSKMMEEKGGMMKGEKSGAMKEDKGKMAKDNMKQETGKAKNTDDKMKMDKMEEKKM